MTIGLLFQLLAIVAFLLATAGVMTDRAIALGLLLLTLSFTLAGVHVS